MEQTSKKLSSKLAGDKKKFVQYLTTQVKTKDKVSQNTIEGYVRAMKHLLEFLDGKPLTEQSIMDFNYYIKMKYQNNSQTPIFSGIRHYLKFLGWDEQLVEKLVKIPSSIETKTDEDILSEDEIRKLYDATKTDVLANTIQK